VPGFTIESTAKGGKQSAGVLPIARFPLSTCHLPRSS
jgi:hypothetical protein